MFVTVRALTGWFFYLNNATYFRPLTQRIILCIIPTKWRSYRDHRLYDVTSPCVFNKIEYNDTCFGEHDGLVNAFRANEFYNT